MNRKFHFLRKICRDIVVEAADQGLDVSVVAVDMNGRDVALMRNDGAFYGSLGPARGKALASLMLKMPTQNAVPMTTDPDPLIARALAATDGILIVPGGMPVSLGGEMIGAVGVAGGHYNADHSICEKVVLASIAEAEAA
jgi:glc operon protein GlcG